MYKILTLTILIVSINLSGCSKPQDPISQMPQERSDIVKEVAPGQWENQNNRNTSPDGVIYSSPDNSQTNGR